MTTELGFRLAGIGVSAIGLASTEICFGQCRGQNTGPIVMIGLGGLLYTMTPTCTVAVTWALPALDCAGSACRMSP